MNKLRPEVWCVLRVSGEEKTQGIREQPPEGEGNESWGSGKHPMESPPPGIPWVRTARLETARVVSLPNPSLSQISKVPQLKSRLRVSPRKSPIYNKLQANRTWHLYFAQGENFGF